MSTAWAPHASLIDQERVFLRRLSIFVDGFTLDAAHAVTGNHLIVTPGSAFWGSAPDHLPPGDPSSAMVDALRSLTRRGTVLRDDHDGAQRYQLPDAVRSEAFAELVASGEIDQIRERHVTYLLAFVEAIDRRVWTAEHPQLMTLLEDERANIDAAFAWAAGHERFDLVLRLATGLYLFWETRGGITDGRRWLSRGLGRAGGASGIRAPALTVAGMLAWMQRDADDADALLEEALDLWRAIGFKQGIGRTLLASALVAWQRGDAARATLLCEEALPLFRASGDLGGVPYCLIVLGVADRYAGRHEQARQKLAEAAELSEIATFAWGIAAARYYEGEVCADGGDLAAAAPAYLQSLTVSWQLRDPWTTGAGVGGLGIIAALCGQAQTAARLFGAADALCATAEAPLPVMDREMFNRVVAAARATMSKTAFERAYAAGAALPPDQAVSEAAATVGTNDNDDVGAGQPPDKSPPPIKLSPRELDVLRLLVEGHRDLDIARELHLSRGTVSDYVGALLDKFNLRSRTALAVHAVRRGLV